MEATESSQEKRIVEQLNFGAKTARRVTWEAWEFTVVGPHLVEVVNASYGFKKDDHTYTVGVEKRDGVPVPAECDCPADVHREPDCKHKVALATVGGTTVLNAATDVDAPPAPLSKQSSESATTAADTLQTDGGVGEEEACPNGDTRCDGPDSDTLPCFPCFEVDD